MSNDGKRNMRMAGAGAQPATSARPPRRLDPRSLLLADNVEYVLVVGDAQRLELMAHVGDEKVTKSLISPDLVSSFLIVMLSNNPLEVRGVCSLDPAADGE